MGTLNHLWLLGLIGGVVLLINASSGDTPLRQQDKDLHSLVRLRHPDLLQGLDVTLPWQRWPTAKLAAMDLAGLDLRGLRMEGRELENVSLRGSHLEKADLRCVRLRNVDLAGADLRRARLDTSSCAKGKARAGWRLENLRLNGADLSGAQILGGVVLPETAQARGPSGCDQMLEIRGDLDGASFRGATLRCVRLINTSTPGTPIGRRNPAAIPPHYAGINFVDSTVDGLELREGNFAFSDFYQANLRHLQVNLGAVDLRFTTLASLRCPEGGCRFTVEHPEEARTGRLSLNVQSSAIVSNLPPSPALQEWPALLCNGGTQWRIDPPLPSADLGPRCPPAGSQEPYLLTKSPAPPQP